MGQLYYPPEYTPLDIIKLGAQLYGLKKNIDLQKGAQDIARQKNALETRKLEAEYGKDVMVPPGSPYAKSDIGGQVMSNFPGGAVGVQGHIPGYKEREMLTREQTAATGSRLASLKEAENKRQALQYNAQWEANMAGKPQSDKLAMLAANVPAFEPSVNIVLDKIEKGELKTRWDVYRSLKADEAVHIHNTRLRLRKEIEDATKKGEIDKVHQLGEIYNSVGPGMLEDFFGFPKEYRPQQQKMDIAASLAASSSTEERLLKGQELISIRQEKRDLQRQIADLERMKSVKILEDESVLTSAKQQLETLKETEQDLLGKKPKSNPKKTGKKDYSHLWK